MPKLRHDLGEAEAEPDKIGPGSSHHRCRNATLDSDDYCQRPHKAR